MRIRVRAGWASIAVLALSVIGCGGPAVNPALPAIMTQPADIGVPVGQTATFTVVATGQAPLTYQWYQDTQPIKNATSSSYTTPSLTTSDSGLFFFVLVSNSLGSIESTEVGLTVESAPAFTSAKNATFLIEQANTFVVTTSGTPISSYTETGSLPAGVTFVDNMNGEAVISGTPTATGTFPITITAQNTISPNATQMFTLTAATQAPAITSVSAATFVVGSSDSFTVTSTGGPLPALTETGTLPAGITFVDNGNGTATLSGAATASGTFNFTINAINGILPNGKQNFILTVDPAIVTAIIVRPADVPTLHNDPARTSQNLNETILTPANVSAATFGKLAFLPVDGQVDAQPLYLSNVSIADKTTHNILYVATEHDSVYAFDAASGSVLWQDTLAGPGETPGDNLACNLTPAEVGISATPVIDRTSGPNGTMFVAAMSKDAAGNYFQRLHALDVATGAELSSGPATIQAALPAANGILSHARTVFDPSQVQAQTGLQFLNGQVYLSFAPTCSSSSGGGWIMAFNGTTLASSGTLSLVPSNGQGPSRTELSADAAGNLYFAEGGSTSIGTVSPGANSSQTTFDSAILKLSTSTQMAIAGYSNLSASLTPPTQGTDTVASSTLVLPDVTDASGTVWHLAVDGDASGNIYVVNRDALVGSGFTSGGIYQEISGQLSLNGVRTAPVYFNDTVYFGASADAVKAFGITNAKLSSAPANQTANVFGLTGASSSISANLATNAILWAVDSSDASVLHAYDATELSREVYNSTQAPGDRDSFGAATLYVQPVIANGKVYVATQNGVAVFGLLK